MNDSTGVKTISPTPEEAEYLEAVRRVQAASETNNNLWARLYRFLSGKRSDLHLNIDQWIKGGKHQYRLVNPSSYRFDDPVLGKTDLAQILKGAPNDLKQAQSTGCRAFVDSCLPVDIDLITESPEDDVLGEVEAVEHAGFGYDLSLTASLTDEVRWWRFDRMDYYWNYLIYEYDLPAPTCPAYITWAVEFNLAYDRVIEAAKRYKIYVCPVAFSSPDGTPATWPDLDRARLINHPTAINLEYHKGKLKFTSTGSDQFYSISQGYEVEAGVTSKVYFGISLSFGCLDGTIKGRALMNLTSPNPATIPDTSINYVSWAKELVPNCYITSAICETLGKKDDCQELSVLRNFRDNYLVNQPGGKELIEDYYRRAPGILQAINSDPCGSQILEGLYENYLSPCISFINEGENEAAVEIYQSMVMDLESRFVPVS